MKQQQKKDGEGFPKQEELRLVVSDVFENSKENIYIVSGNDLKSSGYDTILVIITQRNLGNIKEGSIVDFKITGERLGKKTIF